MMATVRPKPQIFRFGIFELDVTTGELRRDGRLIHLRHQPAQVLRLLLERAGTLVTRTEITGALWPDDLDVDVEQGLNHCMKEIRAALGDRSESPRFVQTLPRRGYRFLGEVHDYRPQCREESLAKEAAEERAPVAPRPESLAAADDPSGHPEVRVRVKVLITRPDDDAVLWSETYERRASDVNRIEGDLTSGIRSGIQVVLAAANDSAAKDHDLETNAPRRDPRFE
ncbi:MAG: winged helix-turn-helix domain-containing protein [Vicinamibacteria bacterium]|nr:winged helix-turn-helix domain-containing protein [Vicinamibacteria bacterium]